MQGASVRFYDPNTYDVADDQVLADMAAEYDVSKGKIAATFGLIPVFPGVPGGKYSLGIECDKCGGSIGAIDCDDARWIMFRVCRDCAD